MHRLPDNREELVNSKNSPLAARMRPRTLDEFTGQNHIIGAGRLLRRAIQADQLSSVIFYGPPGTGKTTLAQIIANTSKAKFISINAVLSGVKEIRESIEQAKINRKEFNQKTILFIDEVHRFNKSQQDALLPHVENGMIILIGATTENPYFEVNKALVSRSRIFQLKSLNDKDILEILLYTLKEKERGYGNLKINIVREALEHIVRIANGDARSALNALELAVETTEFDKNGFVNIGLIEAEESIQKRAVLYDKDGDAHYDTISAFIKSIRGSDPDASLYWMAKMLYAGESPRFIFRRMIILASEDIGLADPNALSVVMSASQAYDYVGLPEGQFHLSHACLYLATAPKSNSTMAFFDAVEMVNKEKDSDVPNHLKDGQRDKNDFGHGKGYNYPHAYREHWVNQQYLPTSLQGKVFYEPSDMGYEKEIKERVLNNRELQLAVVEEGWQDNFLGTSSTGLKNRWLERAVSQTTEILRKVRENIFSLANLNRESLVMDITGGNSILTWEACRQCFAGGVWSRCDNSEQIKTMQDWSKHIEVLNRPELFVSSAIELDKYFSSIKEKPNFDVILGLDIIEKIENTEFLLETLKHILGEEGIVILAEKDPQNSQYLSEILTKDTLGDKLHEKLFSLENELRKKNESKLSKLNKQSKNLGFRNSRLIQEDIIVKRHFSSMQVQKWFDMSGDKISNSIFSIVKTELLEKDYNHLKSATLDALSNNYINWKQSYEFLKLS